MSIESSWLRFNIIISDDDYLFYKMYETDDLEVNKLENLPNNKVFVMVILKTSEIEVTPSNAVILNRIRSILIKDKRYELSNKLVIRSVSDVA